MTDRAYVVKPGDSLWGDMPLAGGLDMQLIVGAEQSEGAYTLVRGVHNEPYYHNRPHMHERDDESVYVLSGNPTVTVGGEAYDLDPGSFIYMPRGVVHEIVAEGPWSYLSVSAPGGIFDGLFRAFGEAMNSDQPFDKDRQREIQREFGIYHLDTNEPWFNEDADWFPGQSETSTDR